MKIITSPAKLMDVSTHQTFLKSTSPHFIEEAELLQSHLKEKSPKYLMELMEISQKLADENWDRNQNWTSKPTAKNSAQALYAFKGEVYRGLNAESLDENAIRYLQKNYRILSGLYGLLKPSDRVMLYRLEMGRKFKFEKFKDLYEFWKPKLTEQLNSELKKNDLVLNLASKEYFKVLDRKALHAKVIDFDFFDYKEGKLRTIVVYTKHARGMMVRFCAQNNVRTVDGVKAFNLENYHFDESLSTESKFVFTR